MLLVYPPARLAIPAPGRGPQFPTVGGRVSAPRVALPALFPCFRMSRSSEDLTVLLSERAQWTEPWGGAPHGAPCDKCAGSGRCRHECWSCLLGRPSADCPACAGTPRWDADCAVCRGSGAIDGRPRRGVSAFPRVEGLFHYMRVRGADLSDAVLVELRAARAEDVDFDADQGAILVIPAAIVRSEPVDERRLERVARLSGSRRAG